MSIEDHRAVELSQQFGTHRVEVDGNLLRIQLHGLFDEQHAREFYALMARVRSQRGSVYCVADMHQAGPPSQGARRHIVGCFRAGQRIDAFDYIGANIMVRSMIMLLKLLRRRAQHRLLTSWQQLARRLRQQESRTWGVVRPAVQTQVCLHQRVPPLMHLHSQRYFSPYRRTPARMCLRNF